MAEEEDIIIEPDPPGPEVEIEEDPAPAKPPVKTPSTDPVEGVSDLKRQIAEAHAKADAEATRRRHAEALASQAGIERQQSAYDQVVTAQRLADTELKAQKKAFKQAMEEGDYDAAAEAQQQIALTTTNLRDLSIGRAQLEAQAKAPRPAPEPEDPLEARIKATAANPASRDWLRRNTRFFSDTAYHDQVVRGIHLALGEGLKEGDPSFYQRVEETMAPPKEEKKPKPTTYAAPPSRSAPGAPPKGTIRLTEREAEVARANHQTLKEYADQKAIAISNGTYNRYQG